MRLLHSPQTVVHLVTLLEDLPVTETLETVADLVAADLNPGAVVVNKVRPQWLPDRSVAAAAGGRVDAERIRAGLATAGLDLPADVLDGLVAETVEHAVRVHAEAAALARLDEEPSQPLPRLELPAAGRRRGPGIAVRAGRRPGRTGRRGAGRRLDEPGQDVAVRSTSTRCSTTRGTRVVVCCGSGGVGKTTTSAALAVRAAERGRRTVVLTIDPARRLAQALGLADARQRAAPGRRRRRRRRPCGASCTR